MNQGALELARIGVMLDGSDCLDAYEEMIAVYGHEDAAEAWRFACREADAIAEETARTAERGWWNMACFNALSAEQQEFLIVEGYLPFGYQPEGTGCGRGAEVAIETPSDQTPGPRFLCLECAISYLEGMR